MAEEKAKREQQIRLAESNMNRSKYPILNVYVYIEQHKGGFLRKSGENHGQLRVTPVKPENPSKLVLDIPSRSISIDLTNINLSEVTTQTYKGNEYVVINHPKYGSIHIRECNDMTYKIEGNLCHPELTLAMITGFLTKTQELAATRPTYEQLKEAKEIRDRDAAYQLYKEQEKKMVDELEEKIERSKRMGELEGRFSALKRGGKKRRTRKHKAGKKHKKTQRGGKRGKRTQKGRGKRRATRKSSKKKH